ncbi:hypothetical protein Bbelb_183140 [Branchiostoma belcheri]|nr:hypothetical protein Bbelb_183140 [Branchiostoma belcheri]
MAAEITLVESTTCYSRCKQIPGNVTTSIRMDFLSQLFPSDPKPACNLSLTPNPPQHPLTDSGAVGVWSDSGQGCVQHVKWTTTHNTRNQAEEGRLNDNYASLTSTTVETAKNVTTERSKKPNL